LYYQTVKKEKEEEQGPNKVAIIIVKERMDAEPKLILLPLHS